MTTEDINIPFDGSWIGVSFFGTHAVIFNVGDKPIYMRVGSASTSVGFVLLGQDTIMIDETCYFKATEENQKIVVTR